MKKLGVLVVSSELIEKNNKIGFGDFQTPLELARKSCIFISNQYNFSPEIMIEPTCGIGNFIQEAIGNFSSLKKIIGIDLNEEYIKKAKRFSSKLLKIHQSIEFFKSNAFTFQYNKYLEDNKSIIVLGNLPWVTNSGIGAIDHDNLPQKSNILDLKGIEAITGKSNFDISEYIFLILIEYCQNKDSVISLLIKTSVARKLLKTIWKKNIGYSEASIAKIDAKNHFDVAVDACLFTIRFTKSQNNLEKKCSIFASLENTEPSSYIADFNGYLTNNPSLLKKNKSVLMKSDYIWRNGIKHDLSKVMELTHRNGFYYNGYGEKLYIEEDLVFPLYKSSDLTKDTLPKYRKYVIVTQKYIGESTNQLKQLYPKTWAYLLSYQDVFSSRKSSIYKNKPMFSIFSVGDYSFSKYKIAIAAFAKKVKFHKIFSENNKPIMLDDTCNFISFDTKDSLEFIFKLINQPNYIALLNSLIFPDSKRPITTEILNGISLYKLAEIHKQGESYIKYITLNKYYSNHSLQGQLFVEPTPSVASAQ